MSIQYNLCSVNINEDGSYLFLKIKYREIIEDNLMNLKTLK